jgi:tetratricopeptide (TPR) repeat protein
MSERQRAILVLVAVLGVPAIAAACLWDYDTLKQERTRFPSTLELITGKFLRHSKEFYEWRIQDRLYKLAADPTNLGYHDDLAVAYQKTGQHAKAVEAILAKEKISPGLYETYSNLGTFHILAGDLEKGLPYIDKALAINPDAHFGRERYQKWLVEYAIAQRRGDKAQFPLRSSSGVSGAERVPEGFHEFLRQRLGKHRLTDADLRQAVKGILGMMRFANHDNPLLLEVLGDVLLHDSPEIDAKQLAARAYLKASYEVKDPAAQQAYRHFAEQALKMQLRHPQTSDELKLPELEAEFAAELADANQWYEELKSREIGWIRDGKDADAEFESLYSEDPVALGEPPDVAPPLGRNVAVGAGLAAILLVGFVGLRWLRRPAGAQ